MQSLSSRFIGCYNFCSVTTSWNEYTYRVTMSRHCYRLVSVNIFGKILSKLPYSYGLGHHYPLECVPMCTHSSSLCPHCASLHPCTLSLRDQASVADGLRVLQPIGLQYSTLDFLQRAARHFAFFRRGDMQRHSWQRVRKNLKVLSM